MRVSERVTIHAPAAAVWDLVGDPMRYPRFMSGITRWEPVADAVSIRPRFAIEVRVGATELGGTVEVTKSVPPSDLTWASVRGIEHRGHWLVREGDSGRTEVTLAVDYRAPRGVLGSLADTAALPLLQRGVRRSLARLKAQIEGEPAGDRQPVSVLTHAVAEAAFSAGVLTRAGLAWPSRPSRVARAGWALARWDATPAGGCAVAAALHPDDPAIVDERGRLTFSEVHRRTNALAHALAETGAGPGAAVAIMCRNHRGFVEATLAASKLGADALFINTGLAEPQVRAVLARERAVALVHDEEFAPAAAGIDAARRFVAWHDGRRPATAPTLEALARDGDRSDLAPPRGRGRIILLTSGTTGAPKGAARRESDSLAPVVALLEKIPLHARGVTFVVSPLFHSWGYTHFGLATALSSTLVLRRRFDAEATLATIAAHRVTALVVVPTMLQRILALPRDVLRRHDTSSLRVVAVSGASLPGALATRFMDEFGDILFNLYGSTEVAWATIATPADLRAAPGTAGRPPHGSHVSIRDDIGRPVPAGAIGRIFAGNGMTFDGYTDGRGRQLIDGMTSTGDLGHLDDAGRLFVDGREDDMIVSGGENVFPSEVEDVLAARPDVLDVTVVGVADEAFGQRLEAHIVPVPGAVPSARELKRHVARTLAPFKVPRAIHIVEELPHNETGKLLRPGAGGPA